MSIKKVTVAGSGVLGSQIAFQTAFKGIPVAVYDINEEAIAKGKERFEAYKLRYITDLGVSQEEVDAAYQRLSFYTNLTTAVSEADLVIEAIPELLDVKRAFYEELSKVAPKRTIFASNSSTLVPSQLLDFVDRPAQYLHLHFANEIWKFNVAEVMKHARTDDTIFNEVIHFAETIGMVPVPIHKEQSGYVLNSLLVPFLDAAQKLVVNGVSDIESVDRTWKISTGAPSGPFEILDIVGMITPYNLSLMKAKAGDKEAAKIAEWLKTEYIDKGRLGKQSGKGFYDYTDS